MNSSFDNIRDYDLDFTDQSTSSSRETTSITASSENLGDIGTHINACSAVDAERKARRKAHKDKSRQKKADKRNLQDLKVLRSLSNDNSY